MESERVHKSQPETAICECGILVRGISKAHLKAMMKIHKKSKMHKQLMDNKK
jgi:hypothetical protein